uniref:Alkylglycerone-phosphate synthase n=1 Tax=Strigamia maritima TaxID=126957 RepID=T1IXQ1_STRMM
MNAYSGIFDVEGIGTVCSNHMIGNEIHQITLNKVGYALSGKRNLISGNKQNRPTLKFVEHKGLFKLKATRCDGNLSKSNIKPAVKENFEAKTNVVESKSVGDLKLWHRRLMHIGVDSIVKMSNQVVVKELPKLSRRDLECISCIRSKQTKFRVTMSAMEAELIALSELVKEMIWFKRCLNEVGKIQGLEFGNFVVHCDNRTGMHFVKNDVDNSKTKYIDVKIQFEKENYESKLFSLQYINSKENLADILTKRVNYQKIVDLCQTLNDIVRVQLGLFKRIPDLVVWPESHSQVAMLVELATEHNVGLIPIGG